MNKFFQILKKVLARDDYFYLSLIVISFITALIIEDGSWQLILISVGILFLVALISSVAQKFTEYYENIPRSAFSSNFEFQVTTQSSEMGTRQTIENFDNTDEYSEITKEEVPAETPQPTVQQLSGNTFDEEYSGVRIIRKKKLESDKQDSDFASEQDQSTFRQVKLDLDLEKSPESEAQIESPQMEETSDEDATLFGNIPFSVTETKSVKSVLSPLIDEQETHEVQSKSDTFEEEQKDTKTISNSLQDLPQHAFFENLPFFGDEPKKELDFFISRILFLIKSTVNVNTIGLFTYNENHNCLKLYAFVTENEDYLISDSQIELGNDIISLVQTTGKPEILSPINYASVLDILPYYNQIIEIKSFAGIPIYQKDKVIGVLTLDSFEHNTFDKNFIGYIGLYSKLLSSLFTSFGDKFEYMISVKTLDAINRFRSMLVDENISFDNILSAAFDTIKDILGFDNIGFCNYSSQMNCWKIQALQGNENFVKALTNQVIDTKNSLISKTLFQKEIIFLTPIGDFKQLISTIEPFKKEGYFISVPLKSLSTSYGSIFVYGDNSENVSAYDAEILKILCEQIASTIEKYLYINVFQSHAHTDPYTGILNPNAYYQRLSEEISRAIDFNTKLAFLTLQIDNYESYKDISGLDESLQKLVIGILKSRVNKYDLIGHLDEKILGVAILNRNQNEIKIWADQLRKEIANKFITFGENRLMVTVSMGIALIEQNDSIDSLTTKTLKMLRESSLKKNTISIY